MKIVLYIIVLIRMAMYFVAWGMIADELGYVEPPFWLFATSLGEGDIVPISTMALARVSQLSLVLLPLVLSEFKSLVTKLVDADVKTSWTVLFGYVGLVWFSAYVTISSIKFTDVVASADRVVEGNYLSFIHTFRFSYHPMFISVALAIVVGVLIIHEVTKIHQDREFFKKDVK